MEKIINLQSELNMVKRKCRKLQDEIQKAQKKEFKEMDKFQERLGYLLKIKQNKIEIIT